MIENPHIILLSIAAVLLAGGYGLSLVIAAFLQAPGPYCPVHPAIRLGPCVDRHDGSPLYGCWSCLTAEIRERDLLELRRKALTPTPRTP